MREITIEGTTAIGGGGTLIEVPVWKDDHLKLNVSDTRTFGFGGRVVRIVENKPLSLLAQLGLPEDSNLEQLADLFRMMQGKEPREAREIAETSSYAQKLLSLGTYGNLAQIASLIVQISADPRVHQIISMF